MRATGTRRAASSSCPELLGSERCRLLLDLVARPLVVAAALARLVALGLLLALHQIGVRGEVLQRLSAEVGDRSVAALVHPLRKLGGELVDDLEAAQHGAGADLDGRRSERDELDRIVRRLDPADAADRRLPIQLASDLGDEAERDRPDG